MIQYSETSMVDLFLTCDQDILGKAILALDDTKIPELGWDETDIVFGKYMATWARNKKKFTGIFLLRARLLVIKYRFQMLTIARERAARKALKQEEKRVSAQKPIEGSVAG